MEATPHEKPVALKGNVYVSTYGQTKVHSYLSPPDGLMVNTQIVESRSSVAIFDGQLHLPYAEEVASYIKTIGKPVDRFILSHGHSDHWSGLQVLTERFPAAEVYAISGVAELIRLRGSKTHGLQRVPSRPTCRSSNRRAFTWGSISRRRHCSVFLCRMCSSLGPTRCANEAARVHHAAWLWGGRMADRGACAGHLAQGSVIYFTFGAPKSWFRSKLTRGQASMYTALLQQS
jgi:Metallo-beta-lactamase superfamily